MVVATGKGTLFGCIELQHTHTPTHIRIHRHAQTHKRRGFELSSVIANIYIYVNASMMMVMCGRMCPFCACRARMGWDGGGGGAQNEMLNGQVKK